jgi:FKBP-type peptidyl-prolyl cis-trans isomerase (trigger factor)
MTREEIKRRLDQLAREYVETHNPQIGEELYKLAKQLEEMEKLEKQ